MRLHLQTGHRDVRLGAEQMRGEEQRRDRPHEARYDALRRRSAFGAFISLGIMGGENIFWTSESSRVGHFMTLL